MYDTSRLPRGILCDGKNSSALCIIRLKPSNQPDRHLDLSDEDRAKLLDGAVAKNTKNATQNWINVLNGYLKTRKIANSIDEILDVDLPRTLELFYSEVTKDPNKRSKKESKENINVSPERYSNTSMHALCAAVNRYIKKNRKIDIISDQRFEPANRMFEAILKDNKKTGKGAIRHKEPITEHDRERLSDYFSLYLQPDALVLQRFVQYNLMFYLCRRGRENLTRMPKNTFNVSMKTNNKIIDLVNIVEKICFNQRLKTKYFCLKIGREEDGTLFIYQKVDEADKNHDEKHTEPTSEAKIYQIKGSSLCPVKTYDLYTSRLDPNCDFLWQIAKPKVTWDDEIWYTGEPQSKNKIGGLMSTLSKVANLSKPYTNHCVRATCVTILDHEGFEARHIMSVSGHKIKK